MQALELKIPPVALALAFTAIMWVITKYGPAWTLEMPWGTAVALMCYGAGCSVALAGVVAFRLAKTTVDPRTPEAAAALVTTGVYRYSRNPMYLGLLLVLIGWAIDLSHVLAFALLPLFVFYLNRFQIDPEEQALLAKFGGQFSAYTRVVRRWL
jgi:protein-S-isoprenylcysteine O-methyltransferase Ste14